MEGIAGLIADSQELTVKRLDKRITESYESLARSVAQGFAGVDKRFDEVDKKFAAVDKKFEGLETRLSQQISGINNRIDDLALNRATRDQLLVLDKRVLRVEQKLGIDFKKPQHA